MQYGGDVSSIGPLDFIEPGIAASGGRVALQVENLHDPDPDNPTPRGHSHWNRLDPYRVRTVKVPDRDLQGLNVGRGLILGLQLNPPGKVSRNPGPARCPTRQGGISAGPAEHIGSAALTPFRPPDGLAGA